MHAGGGARNQKWDLSWHRPARYPQRLPEGKAPEPGAAFPSTVIAGLKQSPVPQAITCLARLRRNQPRAARPHQTVVGVSNQRQRASDDAALNSSSIPLAMFHCHRRRSLPIHSNDNRAGSLSRHAIRRQSVELPARHAITRHRPRVIGNRGRDAAHRDAGAAECKRVCIGPLSRAAQILPEDREPRVRGQSFHFEIGRIHDAVRWKWKAW
jgi:hypothetical protein